MSEKTEPCPSCGRQTPVNTRCGYCITIADMDLKNLQADYLQLAEAKEEEATPLPSAVVVMSKTGEKVPLTNPKVKIGRDLANQVVITDDTFISRHHAWITFEEGGFWLEDLGSTNGTLLNGNPVVKRQQLCPGEWVTPS